MDSYGQNFTLEQMKTLDAVARHGSIAGAAQELHKVHSAVLYTMKSLEELSGVFLFDRSGYRTGLTQHGERIWKESKSLLAAEENLRKVLSSLKTGWEPSLKVVYDGVFPFELLLPGFKYIQELKIPTQLTYYTEYLDKVESTFHDFNCDIMVSVLPPRREGIQVFQLPKIKLVLVAARKHQLVKQKLIWKREDLKNFMMVSVRGGDLRLNLATEDLQNTARQFHVPDFQSKKSAILEGVGFGWMPEYMIKMELKKGQLSKINWQGPNISNLIIHLGARPNGALGRAGQTLIKKLLN